MNKAILLLLAVTFILACSDSKYKAAENVADLIISFADPSWDGKKVPSIGQCTNCGGEGLSPSFRVQNVPKNTDTIIAEFKDKTMQTYHGAVKFKVTNKTEFIVPSVPEQTFDLPEGVETESEHTAPVGLPGAYMAPCGCGYNNKYMAYIFAIGNDDSGQRILLGKGKITLGKF